MAEPAPHGDSYPDSEQATSIRPMIHLEPAQVGKVLDQAHLQIGNYARALRDKGEVIGYEPAAIPADVFFTAVTSAMDFAERTPHIMNTLHPSLLGPSDQILALVEDALVHSVNQINPAHAENQLRQMLNRSISTQEEADELTDNYGALQRYWEMIAGMKKYQDLARAANKGTLRNNIMKNLPSYHMQLDAESNLTIYEPVVRSKIAGINTQTLPAQPHLQTDRPLGVGYASLSDVPNGKITDKGFFNQTSGVDATDTRTNN